jgi:Fe-S-cluster containining protein
VTDDPVPAGELSSWFAAMQVALRGEGETDVPCGRCTACCRSAQFVHIEPDETDTLAHVPAALRVRAPGRPRGHVVLGYDEHGRCPMLGEHGCTIYEHRPRTCRTYDCRVFAATGIAPDPTQPAVAERVRRWRFVVDTPAARRLRDELERAAADLADLPPTRRAVAAVEAVGRSGGR